MAVLKPFASSSFLVSDFSDVSSFSFSSFGYKRERSRGEFFFVVEAREERERERERVRRSREGRVFFSVSFFQFLKFSLFRHNSLLSPLSPSLRSASLPFGTLRHSLCLSRKLPAALPSPSPSIPPRLKTKWSERSFSSADSGRACALSRSRSPSPSSTSPTCR